MKFLYIFPLLLVIGCSSAPKGVVNGGSASNNDQAIAATGSPDAPQKSSDEKGRYRVKQDYEIGDLLVHIGDLVVTPKGVWVGAFFENKSAQNVQLNFSGAYVDVDNQEVQIDMAKGETALMSEPISANESTKGTLVFPAQSSEAFQADAVKRIILHLGKAYDSEGAEIADVEIFIPLE